MRQIPRGFPMANIRAMLKEVHIINSFFHYLHPMMRKTPLLHMLSTDFSTDPENRDSSPRFRPLKKRPIPISIRARTTSFRVPPTSLRAGEPKISTSVFPVFQTFIPPEAENSGKHNVILLYYFFPRSRPEIPL